MIRAAEYLQNLDTQETLRICTVGSVDDGKSTLIGRLFYDTGHVYDDHLAAVRKPDTLDLSLLTDGLRAEREQGITIDVAYRYFFSQRRKFILADCPGHEQYTRNMVTGASTAEVALLLVDGLRGITTQTKRHMVICSLLGIRHIAVLVNKMDLVGYAQTTFDRIVSELRNFAVRLSIPDLRFIPVSALSGENVANPGKSMPWYQDKPVLTYLEQIETLGTANLIDLRFPVQQVIRASGRHYAGSVVSGILRPGAQVAILPSNRITRIRSIEGPSGPLEEAFPPQSITVTLEDESDVCRGDLITPPRNLPESSALIEATVIWLGNTPLAVGSPVIVRHLASEFDAEVLSIRYRLDPNTLHREEVTTLHQNEIGRVLISLSRPMDFDPYARNRTTGAMILIHPESNETLAAALILDRRAIDTRSLKQRRGEVEISLKNVQDPVTPEKRRAKQGQRGGVVWLTGAPGSGKSTLAFALEERLFHSGALVRVLDGDQVRHGLSSDLGFSDDDRAENIRRVAEVAKLFVETGFVVLCAFVSPKRAHRAMARDIIGAESFLEIGLHCPLEIRESRDKSGFLAKAKAGFLTAFTGTSAPYEEPDASTIRIETNHMTVEESVKRVLSLISHYLKP